MSKRKILKHLEELRARNNKEWMRLVGLSLECDEIKNQVKLVLRRILINDRKIQACSLRLIRHELKQTSRPRRS